MKIQTQKVINCFEWDGLVQETYGKPYNFQQQESCQDRGNYYITISTEDIGEGYENTSIPEEINGEDMGIAFSAWKARDPKEWNGDKEDERFLDLFWERNFYPDIQVVANDLCRKGLIEAGDYTINIDW